MFCMRMPQSLTSVAKNRSIFRTLKKFPFLFRRSSLQKARSVLWCGTSLMMNRRICPSPLCKTSSRALWCLRLERRNPRRGISICSVPPARNRSRMKIALCLIRLWRSVKSLRLLLTIACATRNRSIRSRMLSARMGLSILLRRWSM